MRKPPRLEERLEAQRAARERTRTRIAQIRAQPVVIKARRPTPKQVETRSAERDPPSAPRGPQPSTKRDSPSLAPKRAHNIHAGAAGLTFFDRIDSKTPLAPQPWTLRLTELALEAATQGSVVLSLVWPAPLDSIVPLHALASLERNMATELSGLRTLLYPGHHASRSGLNAWLISRRRLAGLYRSLWTTDTGGSRPVSVRESKSMRAVLAALNAIEIESPEVLDPALGEVLPTFIFDPASEAWRATVANPLERTLRKVSNQKYRTDLRAAIGAEWTDGSLAPGALLIVHNSSRKRDWNAALQNRAVTQDPPELFLYDATSASNFRAVRRIPEFLKLAREGRYAQTGALIVTDDPKTFFSLRARLGELHIPLSVQVLAAEADEALLSSHVLPADWIPQLKSNALINVAVVDRDACGVATNFYRLAPDNPGELPPGHEPLLEAGRYLLRLSNLPAGYRDLTAATADGELDEYSSNRNAWSTVEQAIRVSLAAGCYGSKMPDVEKAITKARKLVDNWAEATPMALKLQAAVRKHAIDSRDGLVVVLPSQRYIMLAHRFLARTLGDQWVQAEPQMEWHTLSTVAKDLSAVSGRRHFVFVGVNRNVLRILLSHPDLPHGSSIFVSYGRAQSILTTLCAMKGLPELKAYRGRIGLLIQELERRLAEVPNLQSAERLGELSLTFSFDEKGGVDPTTEQSYYRFDLDGGGRAYRSGLVFKYEPDDDPVFRRTPASQIKLGDFIFDMSERLRGKVEAALQINQDGMNSTIYPERALLRLYHQDVQRRSAALFSSTTRTALAREIHAKMVTLDAGAKECRLERVAYWLDLKEDETTPHASKDPRFFKLFCRALAFSDEDTLKNWNFVKNARRFNQNLGRTLAAQYAEIIFQPESATTYRHIPADLVRELQQEALHCVFRVERVEPPATKD
jgi:hypothetical protein